MPTRHHAVALLLVALAAWPRLGRAQDGARWLTVDAPEGCIDAAAVSRAVEEIAPRRSPRAEPFLLRVEERRGAEPRYVMQIARGGGEVARTLEAPTCEALSAAAVAVLALSSAPDALPSRAEPAAPPAPPAPPTAPAVGHERPSEPPARLPPWQVRLGLSGGVDAGSLPSAMPTVTGRAGASMGRWSVEVDVAGGPEQRVEIAPGRGATLASLTGSVRGAYLLGGRAFALGPYVGAGAARVAGAGFGAAAVRADSATWATAAAGALATAQVAPHVRLRADVGAWVPFARPSYVLLAVGEVYRPAAVSARATLGVDVELF